PYHATDRTERYTLSLHDALPISTGNHAYLACQQICRAAGRLLGLPSEEVFPSSTGIIGLPLPTEKILAALATLISERGATKKHVDRKSTRLNSSHRTISYAVFCL